MKFYAALLELIKNTSTNLPEDINRKLKSYAGDSPTFSIINETLCISRQGEVPICQDTGFPYFYIKIPYSQSAYIQLIQEAISRALIEATTQGFLRPNTVHSLTNQNYGNNLGEGLPFIDWEFTLQGEIECHLLLKGGGSENASGQYSLPLSEIGAGRDINGIINTVLYHLHKIQGQGCAPGIIGVAIGGDRAMSMKLAKKQLFRSLEDINSNSELLNIEQEILSRANQLNIGAMGLGGEHTLLGVKAAFAARHPASFFVSIAYLCWVARRGKCLLNIN